MNREHFETLQRGRRVWNAWRRKHPNVVPRLQGARLDRAQLRRFDLSGADLREAWLREAHLEGADLSNAYLHSAHLDGAWLDKAEIWNANLSQARLPGARLRHANLRASTLRRAVLTRADFTEANLMYVSMPLAQVGGAKFRGAHVFGISAWSLVGKPADQRRMIVFSPRDLALAPRARLDRPIHPTTVDDLETAQFLHLLMDNPRIARALAEINDRAVLLLGRFTAQRRPVLDRLKALLQRADFVPLLFDFPSSQTRDLTETVACLAHLSCFVIADLTSAKSVPQELGVIAPYLPSVPIVPILRKGHEPYSLFEHIARYPWVQPIVKYRSLAHLEAIFDREILRPGYAAARRLAHKKLERQRPPAPENTLWPPLITIDPQRLTPGYR